MSEENFKFLFQSVIAFFGLAFLAAGAVATFMGSKETDFV